MRMLRTLVLTLALAALGFVPVASACCHLYDVEQQVGPCTAEWHGDAFHGYQDSAGAHCSVGGETVGATVDEDLPPCRVWPEGAYCA